MCLRNARPRKDEKGSLASCSRNAHDKNVLVRRAHSRIDQATLENEMENWKDARGEGRFACSLWGKLKNKKVPVGHA